MDIIKSCYSGIFYREKVLQSSGFYSLRYLFKLLFVIAIIQTIIVVKDVNPMFPDFDLSHLVQYSDYFPEDLEINIKDSPARVEINKELPYTFTVHLTFNDPQTVDIRGNPVSLHSSLNILTFLPKSHLITTELDSMCRKYNSFALLFEDSIVICKREINQQFGGNYQTEPPSVTNLESLPKLFIDKGTLIDALESIANFGPFKVLSGYRLLILGVIDWMILLGYYLSALVSWGWSVFVYSTFCWFGMILLWVFSRRWFEYYVVLQISLHSITPCVFIWLLQEDSMVCRSIYGIWTLAICYLYLSPTKTHLE